MRNRYTIGIYFDSSLKKVALILKRRPEWQVGNYNFPGGHIEENENGYACVIREFKEECDINTITSDWRYIGIIKGDDYTVEIFTALHGLKHGNLTTITDELVTWVNINEIPNNIVPNVSWLLPFAINYWNDKNLKFGTFEYNELL